MLLTGPYFDSCSSRKVTFLMQNPFRVPTIDKIRAANQCKMCADAEYPSRYLFTEENRQLT